MTLLLGGWRWLADEPHQRRGLRVLQAAIGLALLFRAGTEAPFAGYLWGLHGLGWGSTRHILGPTLGGLVDGVFAAELGALAVVAVLAVSALGLLFGVRTDLATLGALVAFLLLDQRLPELGDRGDTVIRLALVYLLFTLPVGAEPTRGSLAVWLHNVAVLAIALQVCVLYVNSAFWKAAGEQWQHGTAMYYVSQVEWVTLPALRDPFKNPWVTTTMTYASLIYELFFPMALLSPVRRIWLGFGILFHLGIAVFLGFITFSTVMIGLLAFLLPDRDLARLDAAWGASSRRLALWSRDVAGNLGSPSKPK